MARKAARSEEEAVKTLTPRQRELLAKFTTEGRRATYGGGDVIGDWKVVKEVFLLLGAEWKRGLRGQPGAFEFEDGVDAGQVLDIARESGQVLDPRKAGFFPTPPAVAAYLVGLLDVPAALARSARNGRAVALLEPSAGQGALIDPIRATHPSVEVDCFELLSANRAALTAKGYRILGEDFLGPAGAETAGLYDRVIMNPPFNGGVDLLHVRAAYDSLRDFGRLVGVMSGGVLFRQDKATTAFRAWLRDRDGAIHGLPEGSFRESGTGVNTAVVVVQKLGPTPWPPPHPHASARLLPRGCTSRRPRPTRSAG